MYSLEKGSIIERSNIYIYITCIKLDDKKLYAKYIGNKTRGSPEPESLNWTNPYLKMTTVHSIMVFNWGPAPNYAFMVKI